jgi:hypothetical protein
VLGAVAEVRYIAKPDTGAVRAPVSHEDAAEHGESTVTALAQAKTHPEGEIGGPRLSDQLHEPPRSIVALRRQRSHIRIVSDAPIFSYRTT